MQLDRLARHQQTRRPAACGQERRAVRGTEVAGEPAALLAPDAQVLGGDVWGDVRYGRGAQRERADDGARIGRGDDVGVARHAPVDETDEADQVGRRRHLRGAGGCGERVCGARLRGEPAVNAAVRVDVARCEVNRLGDVARATSGDGEQEGRTRAGGLADAGF